MAIMAVGRRSVTADVGVVTVWPGREAYNECMSDNDLPLPVIVRVPYADINTEKIQTSIHAQLFPSATGRSSAESEVERMTLHLLFGYPTVYIVYAQERNKYSGRSEYTVYVGETNNIRARTLQHRRADAANREDWRDLARRLDEDPDSVWQYIIGNAHFNKSLTLDVENKLMHFLLSSEAVKNLNNRRTNAQGDYYTQKEFDRLFSQIWLDLHKQDPNLFPSEQIIRDSALFKASPFHQLSDEQIEAEETILNALERILQPDAEPSDIDARNEHDDVQTTPDTATTKEQDPVPRLIFVQGAAGTGKTVLLSHLFYRLSTELGIRGLIDDAGEDDWEDLPNRSYGVIPTVPTSGERYKAYILVNHKQQEKVYNQIATKLGLQKKSDDVVMLPSQFINRFSEPLISEKGTLTNRGDPGKPRGKADVVLIDEAHLLLTQGSQGYSGKYMLLDILRRAKVVIAVFDPNQILQSAQRWTKEQLDVLLPSCDGSDSDLEGAALQSFKRVILEGCMFDVSHIRLRHQFRIAAGEPTITWVDDFAGGVGIGPIPRDTDELNPDGSVKRHAYEIKVFDSPVELFKAIREKSKLKAGGVDGHGLSRVVATYDWAYKDGKPNPDSPDGRWNVEMHRNADGVWVMGLDPDDRRGFDADDPDGDPDRFCHPWNYQLPNPNRKRGVHDDAAWAEQPHTIEEVGSTYTIQGFDLNYVGVIIGPSVKYRDGRIVFDGSASKNDKATQKRGSVIDYSEANLRNELNVLLKRGVHGLYLFAVDEELRRRLVSAIRMSFF